MSHDVLEKMISSYMATSQPCYSFCWQGGEPLLMGYDFFKDITDLQQKHGKSGMSVSNSLQTNITLITDELAKHLAEYRFLVGVSLDGPATIHNHYRRDAKGKGTHARVMAGIEILKKYDVDYNILVLVNKNNVTKAGEIYRYLKDMGVVYHQYIECVEFSDNGDLMPYAVNGKEWGDFLCELYDEWIKEDTRKISIRLFDTILAMMVDGAVTSCTFGTNCCQYFVVEHNGDVYPCDFFVEKDLILGNVASGSWEEFLSSETYLEFGRRKSQYNAKCAECEYLRFCAGCCQKNRPGRGSRPGELSVLCEGWKKFYAHSLEGFKRLAGEVIAERQMAFQERMFGSFPDVGRNDPCPCGSGKKYKKCHGATD